MRARSIDGQIALAPKLSFSLPKFKVIDPQNVRDHQRGDSVCGTIQAREQLNIKFNDLVISSLPVTQLLELQVFRLECPTVPFVDSLNSYCGRKPSQAREQINIEFNDLVITSLTVTQLLVLQVFRVESKYALCSLLKLTFLFFFFSEKKMKIPPLHEKGNFWKAKCYAKEQHPYL